MKKILLISLISVLSLSLTSCWEEKTNEIAKNWGQEQIQEQVQEQGAEKMEEEMSDEIQEIYEKVENWEMTNEEGSQAIKDSIDISDTAQEQLTKAKEEMPKMLEWWKAYRECISGVDSKSDMQECMKKSNELARKLNLSEFIEDENIDFEWNNDEKEQLLIEVDKGIEQMEKMLPCVDDAKVISELMQCGTENY